jgi:hypothetical protein
MYGPKYSLIELEEVTMSYARKNLTNVVGSIFVMILLIGIAIWQFYRFVSFRDVGGLSNLQGGVMHLVWSIGMTAFACFIGFLVFSVFLRHDTDDELHITHPPPRVD